jgi:hypothetical protein
MMMVLSLKNCLSVTPTAKNFLESVSTLRFAERVKKGVKNKASLNVDPNVLRFELYCFSFSSTRTLM